MVRTKTRRESFRSLSSDPLVVYIPPPPTPLAQFVQELSKLPFSEELFPEQEPVAQGFPFIQAMTDGLWPVLLRMAEMLSIVPETERRVKEVTRRIDRLLNLGLVLQYEGKMNLAAEAFSRKVVESTEAALTRLSEDKPVRITTFWQDAAAKFFGDLVRGVRQYGEEIAGLYRQLSSENVASRELGVDAILVEDVDRRMLPYLSLENDEEYKEGLRLYVMTACLRLRFLLSTVAALKNLPIKWNQLPKDLARGEQWYLETTWINTQLLRAAAQLSDADYLEATDYATALQLAKKTDPRTLATRFFSRLSKRGWIGTEVERKIIAGLVRRSHRFIKQEIPDAAITHLTLNHFFLQVSVDDLTIERSMAIPTALGNSLSGARARGQIRLDDLFEKIDWWALSSEDFEAMIEEQTLPATFLVKGILRMPKERRGEAAVQLLESPSTLIEDYLNTEAMELILKHKLVAVTDELVSDHLEVFPKEELRTRLEAMVCEMCNQEPNPALFVRLAISLPQDEVRQIILSSRTRFDVVLFLDSEILDSVSAERAGISSREVEVFRNVFTKEQWTLLVLSDQLIIHEGAIGDPERNLSAEIPLWSEVLRNATAKQIIEGKFGRRLKSSLMEEFGEERVFRWLYESKRNVNRLWAEHCRLRDEYHQASRKSTKPRTRK